ncbi:hypothetical protein SFUMM280S_08318 [Streptomyces fumanus]
MARRSSRRPVRYDSGSASASATAYWNGPADTYVRYCFAERTAATSAGAAVIQPTFQPVKLYVLPAELIVTVRSRIPGKLASGTCSAPSKTRCSYTSSVTTSRSRSTASSATAASSARVRTVPVGLCGVLISSSRVRSVTASRSSSRSRRKAPSCGRRVTGTRVPPAIATQAAYES